MTDGRRNNYLTLAQWAEGIDNLKALGCGFIAFYGAEPLLEFENLRDVICYAEQQGIHTTVITSGVVPHFREKLVDLRAAGLKSLSMSFDIVPIGEGSERKMREAEEHLLFFKKFTGVRDVAAIATLTSKNYMYLPKMVDEMTKSGIWTFFDIIHPDRGQPGTKCRNYPGTEELLFKKDDIPFLQEMFKKLKVQKSEGKLVHVSNVFLDMIINDTALAINYDWNCGLEKDFPAFLTVDIDGVVMPCDDFFIPGRFGGYEIKIYNLAKNWHNFKKWRTIIRRKCPGCIWNTHVDAYAIKRGDVPFSDYVHTSKKK
jgi:MoaA/NifB/PqqE/SkfB family radical SAM enzyme